MVLMLTENIPISFKNLKTKAADSSGHLSASVALFFLFFFPQQNYCARFEQSFVSLNKNIYGCIGAVMHLPVNAP